MIRSRQRWDIVYPARKGATWGIYHLEVDKTGAWILIAGGMTGVVLADASNGKLVQEANPHEAAVIYVSWSPTAKKFASAGLDKNVVVWTFTDSPTLASPSVRYSHDSNIKGLSWCPVSELLVSCGGLEVAVWSAKAKEIKKPRLKSTIMSINWAQTSESAQNETASIIVAGLETGELCFCTRDGAPKLTTTLSNMPVTAVCSFSEPDTGRTIIAAADLSQRLYFVNLEGKLIAEARSIGFIPSAMTVSHESRTLLLCGSHGKVSIYNCNGVHVGNIGGMATWTISSSAKPTSGEVIYADTFGHMACSDYAAGVVHALNEDCYAFRRNMVDIKVSFLLSGKHANIQVGNVVRRLAVYRLLLACLTPTHLLVYQLATPPPVGSGHATQHITTGLHGSMSSPALHQLYASSSSSPAPIPQVPMQLEYHLIRRHQKYYECTMMLLASEHVILCNSATLEAYNFHSGTLVRRWLLQSNIRYLKMLGGPAGSENFIVAVEDGRIYKVFVDKQHPLLLVRANARPTCIDINSPHTKVAVVNDDQKLYVYDILTKTLAYHEPSANSVAWNSHHPDLIAYAMNGVLHVKCGNDLRPFVRQLDGRVPGFVVGFVGAKVFYMDDTPMVIVDVQRSSHVSQLLEKRQFDEAYQLAVLDDDSSTSFREPKSTASGSSAAVNVVVNAKASRKISGPAAQSLAALKSSSTTSDSDWQSIGLRSLESLDLKTAARAYQHLLRFDMCWMVYEFMERLASTKDSAGKTILIADVLARLGRFNEAARMYRKIGRDDLAVEMYLDLYQFTEAERLLDAATAGVGGDGQQQRNNRSETVTSRLKTIRIKLQHEKAEFAERTRDTKLAASIYMQSGDTVHAIELMAQHGYTDMLIDAARQIDKGDTNALRLCADKLKQLGKEEFACELYELLGDFDAVVDMKIEMKKWPELFQVAAQQPRYAARVYLPYAEALMQQDKFVEAQNAFALAGERQKAQRILLELADVAITMCQFDDAAYYYWLLACQLLNEINLHPTDEASNQLLMQKYYRFQWLADIYYAYKKIYNFVVEPFRTTQQHSDAIFHIARFLAHELWNTLTASTTNGFVAEQQADKTQAQQRRPPGINLGYVLYALVLTAYELKSFKLARVVGERAKQYVLPSRPRAALDAVVLHCKLKPFTDNEDLMQLCNRCAAMNSVFQPSVGNRCGTCRTPFVVSYMSFDVLPLVEMRPEAGVSDERALELINTPTSTNNDQQLQEARSEFDTAALDLTADQSEFNGNTGKPVNVGAQVLLSLRVDEVVVCRQRAPLRWRFYRNMLPDAGFKAVVCEHCWRTFLEQDDAYVAHKLEKGTCPFCRNAVESV